LSVSSHFLIGSEVALSVKGIMPSVHHGPNVTSRPKWAVTRSMYGNTNRSRDQPGLRRVPVNNAHLAYDVSTRLWRVEK